MPESTFGHPRWLPPLLVVLAGAVAYGNSLGGGFVYDDILSIVDNPSLRHLGQLGRVLSPSGEALTLQGRPFLALSLALNYACGGLQTWGYHAVNVGIHLLASLALYGIVRAVTRRAWLAAAIAALWAVHPLQTEAVTYVVQRAESLMGLCYLATAWFYIQFANTKRPAWAAAAVAACLAGMGTKEVMVSAPVMLWLFDRAYLAGSFGAAWRARRGLLLGLAATWIPLAWFVLAGGGNRGGSVGFGLDIRPIDYWLTQGEAVLHYLRLVFWPSPLVFDYGRFVYAHPAAGIVRVAAVALLLAASLWAWRRAPRAGFLALFFFAILAPTSLLPGTTQMIAEHRMYLASIPVIALTVVGLDRWLGPRSLLVWPAAALVLIGLTLRRNQDYRSPASIWADTAAKRPGNALAHYNLGYALGPGSQGEAEMRAAIRLKPDYVRAYDVLGYDLSLDPARRDEAIAVYRQALAIDRHDVPAVNNLGQMLIDKGAAMGGTPEGLAALAEAVQRLPRDPRAHEIYGRALSGDPSRAAEAMREIRVAIRLDPRYGAAHDSLGLLLWREPGREGAALAEFQEAVRDDPDNAEAHCNLASSLASAGRPDSEVEGELRTALRLNPKIWEAWLNLGTIVARDPARRDEAAADFRRVLQLQPDQPAAREGLQDLGDAP